MTDQIDAAGALNPSAVRRAHMVESQVRPNNVNDRRVIEAMRVLPREAYAPAGALAYADADIPLGGGRVMLAPMVIARLAQLVMMDNPAHVLVVGAGSGYGAALLASCGAEVVALEEEQRLAAVPGVPAVAGMKRVLGRLVLGWPAGGPYDAILIEGAVPEIPPGFATQLRPGGRVIAILSDDAGLGTAGPPGLGRAVIAEPVRGEGTKSGFALARMFDCAARPLPAFQPAPVFSFEDKLLNGIRMRSHLLATVMAAGVFAPCVLLPVAAKAAAPETLTEALVEAYDNNATLQEQRASLRQTDEGVPNALSGWRPTVTIQAAGGRSSGDEILNNNTLDPLTGLPTNGRTKIDQTRNETSSDVTVTQQVYNGGRVVDQTRQATNAVYAARAQLLQTEQTVFLSVVNAYVTVIEDGQVLTLDQNDEAVLQHQLQATQDQFNVGEITETSVAQAQASLAQALEQVQVAAGNLQIAKENFRELVGDYPGNLVPPQPLSLPVDSKDEAAAQAQRNNPNVIAALYTDAANKDAIDVAFSALLPQLSLQASAFYDTNPSTPNSFTKGASLLGQLTWQLYQGGAEYSAIRLARAREQQSFATIIDAQRTAFAQATQAWVAFVASRDAIVSTNTEIKANAIALDGTEREEVVGTQTTLDVLNAQQLLLNSQVQQVQNIATLVNNSYTVASAIGRLTATDLGLPVQQYDDLKYYHAVKYAGIGTGESADRRVGIAPDGSLLNPTIEAGPPQSDMVGAAVPGSAVPADLPLSAPPGGP